MTNTVENFENMLLELCGLCSQNKQSLLGKIGMKQLRLVEMFKERENITLNQSNNGWISVDDKSLKQYANKEILIYTAWGNIKKAIYSVDNSLYIDDDGKEYQFAHWFSDEFGDFMWEFDEVKYWQPLPKPPKEC